MNKTGQKTNQVSNEWSLASRRIASALLVFQLMALVSQAPAQVAERLRLTEQERQRQFEARTVDTSADDYLKAVERDYVAFDTGGWYTLNYFNFKDTDNDRRTPDALKGLILQDLRTWFNVIWRNDISLYVRLKKLRFDFQKEDGVILPDVDLLEEPDLDLAFVSIPHKKMRFQIGRQFLQSGRGLVFSGVLDAISASYRNSGLSLDMFYGSTPYKTHNIDRSIPGFDLGTHDRSFFNFQAAYQLKTNHRFYGFYTSQRDESNSLLLDPSLLNFRYDSDYVGLGASGPISKRSVYYAESVWQSGDFLSSTAGTAAAAGSANNVRGDIDAYSIRAGVNYFVPDSKHSVLSAEFAMATGDEDRADVITTFNGGTANRNDRNFMYFGFYDGGLALSPRLSNMKIWRFGHSFKPLKRGNRVADFQLASILSFYRKHTAGGPLASPNAFLNQNTGRGASAISDPQSNLFGEDVGTGLDTFLSTKIFSDLTLVARYGLFLPGNTYTESFTDAQGIQRNGDDNTSQFSLTATASF